MPDVVLVDRCRAALEREWSDVASDTPVDPTVSSDVMDAIHRSINSNTKSYRYVLPTQLLAKLADHTLDCTCIQFKRGGAGAFDARTIAHKVIVPFDQANEKVLGGSVEPYVSNPLRVAAIAEQYREAQKDRAGWDHLCFVLRVIQDKNDESFTRVVFRHVLREIRVRLEGVRVEYAIPRRISLDATIRLIEAFTSERSGGDRYQALTAALFQMIGEKFQLFSAVRRGHITAADAATGLASDIECIDASGTIVTAVEAKDRNLTITQLADKVPQLRASGITEAFFVAQGLDEHDAPAIRELVEHQFASGHNIYIADLLLLARAGLALVGESGRRRYLELVAQQLNQFSEVTHRRAWADLLRVA